MTWSQRKWGSTNQAMKGWQIKRGMRRRVRGEEGRRRRRTIGRRKGARRRTNL